MFAKKYLPKKFSKFCLTKIFSTKNIEFVHYNKLVLARSHLLLKLVMVNVSLSSYDGDAKLVYNNAFAGNDGRMQLNEDRYEQRK